MLSVGVAAAMAVTGTVGDAAGGHVYREDQVDSHLSSTVVRLGPSVYLHTNPAHYTVGVTAVEVDRKTGDLILYRTPARGERIGVCIVDEDETVSRLGIMAGCTGGAERSVIRLTDKNGKRVRADDERFGLRANVWVLFVGYSRR